MAQEIIKALLINIDGNPEKLNKAVKDAEGYLARLDRKTKESSTTTAAAADAAATKQANAARAIASATETVARQGQVSGEVAKQLLAQGANLAFAFGPAGAVAGAIGIATLAIVGMFTKTREEIEETERRGIEAMNRFAELDAAGQAKAYQRSFTGSRFKLSTEAIFADADSTPDSRRESLFGLGTNELEVRQRQLEAARKRAAAEIAAMSLSQRTEQGGPAQARLDQTAQRLSEVSEALKELRSQQAQQLPIVQETAQREAEIATAASRLKGETRELTDAEKDRAKVLEELNRQATQLADTTQRLVSEQMSSMADRIAAPFDEAIAKARELMAKGVDPAGQRERIDTLEQARDSALGVARALGEAAQAMAALDQQTAGGSSPALRSISALQLAAAGLQTEMANLVEDSEPYLKLQSELAKVLKQIADAEEKRRKALAEINGESATEPPKVRDMADYAREVQQAADGALQLAQNLGGAGEETVGLLRGIAQIAGNLPALQMALKPGKNGAPVSGMSVLTASLPILGALSSIFGGGNSERERRVAENTEAIRDLTARIGLVSLGIAGSAASGAVGDVDRALAEFERRRAAESLVRGRPTLGNRDSMREVAESLGISFTDLQEIATKYGITLDGSVRSFEALRDALEAASGKLAEFGTDLDSQKRQADAEIAIRGITDPLEQWAIRQGAYAGRSSALDGVTAGLDLSTAEGRAQARANAEALFAIMRAGGETLGEGALGGLDGDELLQALLELVDSLDALDETASSATGSTLGAVSGYTGLSAAAGSRIEDYNRALVGYARDAQGTRVAMLTALEALVARTLGPIPLPRLLEGASARAGQGGTTIQIMVAEGAVQLQFTVSGDANAVASTAGDVFEATMSDRLARAIIRARQATGDLSVGPA
jgi:hypothetical protein